MTFQKMMEAGRRMAEAKTAAAQAELVDTLRGLMTDPRFAAVLALIWQNREGFVEAGAEQKLAAHHGCLEHCMGSVHGMDLLLKQLKGQYAGQRARGGRQREDAGE